MTTQTMSTGNLVFDPDTHPKDTLKQFKEFIRLFQLNYDARFPDPPKASMDHAVDRWKVEHTTAQVTDPKPNVQQFDEIRDNWQSKDKVKKVIGMFSTPRLSSDWEAAEPDAQIRKDSTFNQFVDKMETYYKPTENLTLMNFQFRELTQKNGETFPAFCSRIESEAKMCKFKCPSATCTAENIAVRDQIIIGTNNSTIRKEALIKSWDLTDLKKGGTQLESAVRGEAEISGAVGGADVNKLGKYSFSHNKNRSSQNNHNKPPKDITCYNCNEIFNGPAFKHREVCKAKNHKCPNCRRTGHFKECCRNKAEHSVKYTEENDESPFPTYLANLFRVTPVQYKHNSSHNNESDFKVQVVSNGALVNVVADTGAKVCVCGTDEAKQWNLYDKMSPTSAKIKPYNSSPIPVVGIAKCSVTFGSTSIPVDWYIIEGTCEPILSGEAAVQLGIINFTNIPILQPIHMVDKEISKVSQQNIQHIVSKYSHIFRDSVGKLRSHQVKLHVDPGVKPVVSPPIPTPYHLKERVDKVLKEMLQNDVIEKHPTNEPAPWVSSAVIL